MFKLSLDVLPKYRLQLNLVKRRGPALRGNFISRFFRHVFEHKNIKKILGTNIAMGMIAASFIPTVNPNLIQAESPTLQESVNFITQRGSRYPVEKISITQGFTFFHPGIDFDGITGDPVFPIMSGKVEEVSFSKFSYGNSIIINHGNQVTSLYAHLSKIEVKEGQEITTSTEIGKIGATGHAFGDHLHLEVRDHGKQINPLSVLPR